MEAKRARKALEEEVRRLKAELYQASLEASRKTQKMLSLEIKNDKMRLIGKSNKRQLP